MVYLSKARYLLLGTLQGGEEVPIGEVLQSAGLADDFTLAEYQRVYHALNRLVISGLATRVHHRRHGRTAYAITPEGLTALREMDAQNQRRAARVITQTPPPAVQATFTSPRITRNVVICPKCSERYSRAQCHEALKDYQKLICEFCHADLTGLAKTLDDGDPDEE